MAEHLEVLEHQLAVDHSHGVVAEAELHAVWHADHIHGVEEHLTVDMRFGEFSPHLHRAVGISLKSEELLRNESVHDFHRQMFELEVGIEHSLSGRVVCSDERPHL